MRLLRQITSFIAIAGLILMVGGDSRAQDAEPEADEAGAPNGEPQEETADVTVPMEKRAELSPSAMVEAAQSLIKGMQKNLARVVQLQTIARRQKDVIKLNCVNDKLLQVKQLLNIAEAASTNMHEAIAQEDDDGRYHEYGKIVIADQQVTVLVGEAENCVGEELVFIGPTEVDADEPEPADDPTADEPDYDLEPPGYASPFA